MSADDNKGLEHQKLDKKSATSGFGWTMAFNLVNKFLLPLVTLYIARLLGPETMGIHAAIYAVFMASEVLRDAGLAQTYMRDPEVDGKKEGAYMALGVLQGLIPAALLLVLRDQFAEFFRSPLVGAYLIWASVGLLINGFGTIPRAKILRSGRVKESGFREMIANVIALAVALVMVLMGYGLEALVAQLVLNAFLNVAISYSLAPVRDFRPDPRAMSHAVKSSSSTFGANLLFNAYFLADNFVVGRLLDNVALGLFSRAKSVAQLPMQLFSVPMMRPLQVAFSQNSQDVPKLGNIYGRALAAAVMFVVPAFALLAVAAEPLVALLLGPAWLGAIPIVQILCLYFGARTVGMIGGTALVAGGKARLTLISWLSAYTVVALTIALGNRTLAGIAWAFAAGALAVYTLHTVFALRAFPPDAASLRRLRAAVVATLASVLIVALLWVAPLDAWLRLAIASTLALTMHLALLGWLLEGSFRRYLSSGGVRTLYRSL